MRVTSFLLLLPYFAGIAMASSTFEFDKELDKKLTDLTNAWTGMCNDEAKLFSKSLGKPVHIDERGAWYTPWLFRERSGNLKPYGCHLREGESGKEIDASKSVYDKWVDSGMASADF